MPRCTAAASTNVLKVEPGWRRACESRLNWLFRRPGITAAMARMAPVAGSIETIAAAGSVRSFRIDRIACSASRW